MQRPIFPLLIVLLLLMASCGGPGTTDPIDPSDPTTTTDPTDPTATPDPSIPFPVDPSDPTTTTDPTDPTTTPDPTDPTGNTISGTVTAPVGVDLTSTAVGACLQSDTSCAAPVVVGVDSTTGAYTLSGLQTAPYIVIAIKDSDGDPNTVEYVGFYPQTVTPPATGINITLEPYSPDPTDPTTTTDPTDPTTPTEGTISGIVTLTGGSTTAPVEIFACANLQDTQCQASTEVAAGSSFPYTLENVPAGSFYIVAQSDTNGDGSLTAGEYIGFYPSETAPTPVTTPATGINFPLVLITEMSSEPSQFSALKHSAITTPSTDALRKVFQTLR